jgi:hypothetical protein
MQRTLDLGAFKKAVAKPGLSVRADVVSRVHLAPDGMQGDIPALDVNTDYVVLWQFFHTNDIHPIVGCHDKPQIG